MERVNRGLLSKKIDYINDHVPSNKKRHFAPLNNNLNEYRILYNKEIKSNTGIEFSKRTANGTNSLFFTLLEGSE